MGAARSGRVWSVTAGVLAMLAAAGGFAGCSTGPGGGRECGPDGCDAAADGIAEKAPPDGPVADTVRDVVGDVIADRASDVTPDRVSDTTPDRVSDTTTDLASDATPASVPDAAPDLASSDAIADHASDLISDAPPDRVSDAASDVVSCTNPTEIGWTSEPLAATPTALFSTAANDVWMFVGGNLRHFDGHAWTNAGVGVFPATTPGLVWASSASDVWAGGDHLAHWDGTRWTDITRPDTPPPTPGNPHPYIPFAFIDIRGTGPNDVWVRTGTTIYHWDGAAWTERPPPARSILNVLSMWAAGPDDAWLLGGTPMGGSTAMAAYRWTAAGGWTPVGDATDPARQRRFFITATGAAPDDIWGFVDDFIGGSAEIWHFDGQAWTRTSLAPSHDTVVSAWTISRTDIWAPIVGFGDPFRRKRFWHLDGVSWSLVDRPELGDERMVAGARDDDLWAMSVDNRQRAFLEHRHAVCAAPDGGAPPASGWIPQVPVARSIRALAPNDLWGVFDFGLTARRWDGAAWTTMFDVAVDDPLADDLIESFWATSDSDVWVGSDGLFHWDGRTWTNLTPPVNEPGHISMIWGRGPTDTWAFFAPVSSQTPPGAFHWDGATWTPRPNPSGSRADGSEVLVNALWGTSASDVWAAGELVGPATNAVSAVFLHWDGSAWTVVNGSASDPAFRDLIVYGMWGASATSIFAGGGDGSGHARIWRYDGTAWRVADDPPQQSAVSSVWGSSDHDVWAALGDGTLRHFDGVSWTTSDPGADSLAEVTGSGPGDVWVRGVLYGVDALFHLAP